EVAEKLARAAAELSAAEAEARREADRLARTVAGLREALEKVRAIDESRWTKETYQRELSHALTTIEFARMEWNAAAREYPQLEGKSAERADSARPGIMERVEGVSFWTLARIGLGLTFPLWALGAIGLAIAAAVFLSR
ncbi:MAG: hypothetical protein J7M29_09325, partial [Verrucomicrobia bacterium]|nr:hypothetical protein [Verrucomicrobiota bacterium]